MFDSGNFTLRSLMLASFHEEWPSPGGRPGWAADLSDPVGRAHELDAKK